MITDSVSVRSKRIITHLGEHEYKVFVHENTENIDSRRQVSKAKKKRNNKR